MKKAQFFILSLVFIALAFFVIFMFFRTIDSASNIYSEHSSFDDLLNLINSAEARNDWLANNWWNLSWQNRSIVSITGGITNPSTIDANIVAGFNCTSEIRVINSSGAELQSNVSSVLSPCNIFFNATGTGTYYVYYGNSGAPIPNYRNAFMLTGNSPSYSVLRKENSPKPELCRHLSQVYLKKGSLLACSEQIYNNNQLNYSINFTSLDLSFKGFIN